MKKHIFIKIFVFVLLCNFFSIISLSDNQSVEFAVKSDISAFIDCSPIKSYNYKGNTYFCVEDLVNYGFDVIYDNHDRALKINREPFVFSAFTGEFINEKKSLTSYDNQYIIYKSDISTYLNGSFIPSINIGGKTLICADFFESFGYCVYDDTTRHYNVKILEKEIENMQQTFLELDNVTVTEKGVFDTDGQNLLYGMKIKEETTRFGVGRHIAFGDFKRGITVLYQNEYKGNEEGYTYYTLEDIRETVKDTSFIYGLRLNSITDIDQGGWEIRYLRDTGEKYLMIPKDLRQTVQFEPIVFEGQLYRKGKLMYEGEICSEKFDYNSFYDSSFNQANVLYAVGYSDLCGIIYYADRDYIYYRGNVVNGVAHGLGEIYSSEYEIPLQGKYPVYLPEKVEYKEYDNKGLFYRGSFVDGLFHGEGEVYNYDGRLTEKGKWNFGKREGNFVIYKATIDSEGGNAMFLQYEGSFINDKKNGFGIEYGELGWAFYSGIYKRFIGEWQDGNWKEGLFNSDAHDSKSNTNYARPIFEGEFGPIGTRVYGTEYRYLPNGQTETRTGYFIDYEWVGY